MLFHIDSLDINPTPVEPLLVPSAYALDTRERKLEKHRIRTNFSTIMNPILSAYSASISELKRNPSQLIEQAAGEAVAILNHNKPTAYLIPAETYEWISNLIEDQELREIIERREEEKAQAKEVTFDEL